MNNSGSPEYNYKYASSINPSEEKRKKLEEIKHKYFENIHTNNTGLSELFSTM